MRNIQYGGRYSTNLIADVKPAYAVKPTQYDRVGFNNYRPFEELAQNFKVRGYPSRPGQNQAGQDFMKSFVPVSTTHYQPSQYTFVPPLSTLAIPGFSNNETLRSNVTDGLYTGLSSVSSMAGRTGTAINAHIVKPLAVAAAAVISYVSGRHYTAEAGLQRHWKVTIPSFAKPSLAFAGVAVGAFLLAQIVTTNQATPNTNGGTSDRSPGSSRNDASRAIVAPNNVPSSSSQSSNNASGGSSDTQPLDTQSSPSVGTYWDIKPQAPKPVPAATNLQPTAPSSLSNEETSTPPNTETTSPITDTETVTQPPVVSEPTEPSLVPTTEVTVPPTSLQLKDTTLLETDSTTITIN